MQMPHRPEPCQRRRAGASGHVLRGVAGVPVGVVDPARDTSSVTAQGHGKGTRMRGGGFTAAARG